MSRRINTQNNFNLLKPKLTDREEELLMEKNKISTIQKENEKLTTALTSREDYIASLPTEDEVEQSEKEVIRLNYHLKTIKNI